MRAVLEAGFVFWGLFAVFALIIFLYLAWMGWVERKEPVGARPGPPGTGGGSDTAPEGGESGRESSGGGP